MHAAGGSLDVLKRVQVRTVCRTDVIATLSPSSSADAIWRTVSEAPDWQDTFPVLDARGEVVGLVSGDVLRQMGADAPAALVVAADLMVAPVSVRAEDDLHVAVERLLESGLREVPVLDEQGRIVGLLDEAQVTRAYHEYLERLQGTPLPTCRRRAAFRDWTSIPARRRVDARGSAQRSHGEAVRLGPRAIALPAPPRPCRSRAGGRGSCGRAGR